MSRIILIATLVFVAGMAMADDSTWRYGSPNDVRQAGIRAAQNGGYYGGYYGSPVVVAQDPASTWMDIAFRAGSPELYRYTMLQPAQINIYNNVTVYGSPADPRISLGSPDPVGVVDYGYRRPGGSLPSPQYPAALVP